MMNPEEIYRLSRTFNLPLHVIMSVISDNRDAHEVEAVLSAISSLSQSEIRTITELVVDE